MHRPRTPRRSGVLVAPLRLLTLALIVALAGCAGSTASVTPRATVTPTPRFTPLPTSPPEPNQTPLTMQQAWGNVAVSTLPLVVDPNRYFIYDNVATPDGQWLVGVNQACNFIQNPGLPSYAVLYNVATRHLLTMQQLQQTQSQVLAASADANWVVWAEADDPPNFSDWTMFAYNRHTGQVQRLGQAVKGANGQAVAGPFSGPVVDQDHVLWSQVTAPGSGTNTQNSVVRLEDLTTGTVTTLATDAGGVAISWPWAAWNQLGAVARAGSNSATWWPARPPSSTTSRRPSRSRAPALPMWTTT